MPKRSIITLPMIGLMCGTSAAGEIVLELGGVHYDGGAAFSVSVAGAAVGSGTVDPAGEQRQWFGFDVDDKVLRAGGDLTISFTNDINLGADQDRSLLIFGARAGSHILGADDFILVNALTSERIERDRDPSLALWTNEEVAVAPSPPGGWLAAEMNSSSFQDDCGQRLTIDGFPTDGVGLTDAQLDVLGAWAGSVAAANCQIDVIGYASSGGTDEVNQIISLARAKSVSDALAATGYPITQIETKAGGATAQFGPAASDNRRVEVIASRSTPVEASSEPEAAAGNRLVLTLGEDDRVTMQVRGQLSRPEQLWMLEAAKAQVLESQSQ